jgi:hypothetical protein
MKFEILTDDALADRLQQCGQWLHDPRCLALPRRVPLGGVWSWVFEPITTWRWRRFCDRLASVGLPAPREFGLAQAWAEIRTGQGYDDAGGFWLRIYRALFNWPYKPAFDSQISWQEHLERANKALQIISKKWVSCPYCTNKFTGLPGNACENCMNTGVVPE